jgi:hypothetical protein
VGLVLDHPEDAKPVGVPGVRGRLHEPPQRLRVVGLDPLVGVEVEDPVGAGLERGVEQALAVGGVVPAGVGLAPRVRQQRLDQRAGRQQLRRGVGRSVVERDHRVGEALGAAQPFR